MENHTVNCELAIFENENFGQLRGEMRNGDPWFVASDVAKALGFTNPQKAIADHCNYAELLSPNESLGLTGQANSANTINIYCKKNPIKSPFHLI